MLVQICCLYAFLPLQPPVILHISLLSWNQYKKKHILYQMWKVFLIQANKFWNEVTLWAKKWLESLYVYVSFQHFMQHFKASFL